MGKLLLIYGRQFEKWAEGDSKHDEPWESRKISKNNVADPEKHCQETSSGLIQRLERLLPAYDLKRIILGESR
jgi:hypothetical protein